MSKEHIDRTMQEAFEKIASAKSGMKGVKSERNTFHKAEELAAERRRALGNNTPKNNLKMPLGKRLQLHIALKKQGMSQEDRAKLVAAISTIANNTVNEAVAQGLGCKSELEIKGLKETLYKESLNELIRAIEDQLLKKLGAKDGLIDAKNKIKDFMKGITDNHAMLQSWQEECEEVANSNAGTKTTGTKTNTTLTTRHDETVIIDNRPQTGKQPNPGLPTKPTGNGPIILTNPKF